MSHRRGAFAQLPCIAAMVALCALAIAPARAPAQEPQRFVIATGSVAGVYYPVGGAICRLVNRARKTSHLYCDVDVTSGSVANVGLLLEGFYDFAIVQSDVLADLDSLPGVTDAVRKPADVRSVLRLHPEVLTIVVRKDSGLTTLDALKGHRIAAGEAGSGHAATFAYLRAAENWTAADAAGVVALDTAVQAGRLCDGTIDAFINVVGHPNSSILEAADRCGIAFVPLGLTLASRVAATGKGYRAIALPTGIYDASKVESGGVSIGTDAVLVTASDVDPALVGAVVRAVSGNFDEWRRMHPALKLLDQAGLRPDAEPVALHEGAAAAFDAENR